MERAYRRPVTQEEIASKLELVQLAQREGDSFDEGIRLALQAILASPNFLFRVEANPPAGASGSVQRSPTCRRAHAGIPKTAAPRVEEYPVSDIELASRLSYFLWASMPDAELMRVAKAGTLRQPAVLEAQVRRMMADPKGFNLVENWAAQWLQLRNLGRTKPDPKRFPTVDDELLDAMRKETMMFVEAMIKEDRSLLDFIDAPFTFVNGPLARHYGIKGVDGEEFQRVTLDGEQRSGILTQGAILTVSSYPTRTSIPVRGKWVMENLLGTPPPPPPDAVPSLNESNIGVEMSLRERLEQHRRDPNCSPCHMLMDPLGFGLENYDAVGAWRAMDGKFPIDPSGTLPGGQSFAGSKGLKEILKTKSDAFVNNVTEKMLTYSLGRGLERFDRPTVEAISRQSQGERLQVFGARHGSREEQTVPDAECGGREAMNLIFKKQLPRRTFLRGMGSVVALPLLDAMVPAFVRAAGSSPTRLAILYFPNGVQMDTWAIKSDAQIAALPAELPRTLAPLTKYRNDITVLNGLTVDGGRAHGDGPGDHGRAGASYLTGAHPKKTFGKDLQAGISMDQYAAGIIGNQTRFASLELGCEEGIQGGNCDNGYSCAYSNSISWRTPVDAESSRDSAARRLRAVVRVRRSRARSGETREEREVSEERPRFRAAGREAARTSGERLRSPQAR